MSTFKEIYTEVFEVTESIGIEIAEVAEEIKTSNPTLAAKMEKLAIKTSDLNSGLDKFLKQVETFVFGAQPKPVVEMSGPPDFKHAPEMEALLAGKPIANIPDDQVWKTKELNQYAFIQVLKVTDTIITYVRIKDSKQEILYHRIELTAPEFREIEVEHEGYYIIHVTELAKRKRGQPRPDVQWNFVQEVPKTRAYTLANKWASIFAKRKEKGVAY